MSRRRVVVWVAALGLAASAGDRASATITQVDGTIVPTDNDIQDMFTAEGEPLDPVLDAAELPEVFLPNTGAPVRFEVVDEDAGFENSFGWYNVGDDVLTPAGRAVNLHPLFGCGIPMIDAPVNPADRNNHYGDPTTYVQNAEAGAVVNVSFASEQAAGRYKGGFIAFYLITPENNPSSDDNACGDMKDGSDGNDLFGRIYFTQKDLNDDGDFVHHLVYTSPLADDRFYFAFEDLFRGGDNDFSDQSVRVDGLTPPCVPQAEVCDGIDNDCDDLVDADDPDLVGVATPCVCDDVGLECVDSPTPQGQCQTGETVCVLGELACQSTTGPDGEVCDLIDNNCNGIVDDVPVGTDGVGDPCDGPDSDLCEEGALECVGGVIVCNDATGPIPELCNVFDDDCDGAVDEDPVDVGDPCGAGPGVCSPGIEVCGPGGLDCQGVEMGVPEICNGLDDDCDGVIDDSPTDVGAECGVTDTGACEFGEIICNAGVPECAGEIGPVPETCNGVDDDCDGTLDNDPVDIGQPCGIASDTCEPGTIICDMGTPVCDPGGGGTPELCNGLDDDCDGVVDDDPSGVDVPCGDDEGLCEEGVLRCINGSLECVGGFGGTTETCNGIDDDCDGEIDEGDLCDGGVCENGECAAPCAGGEFDCPIGETCVDGICLDDPCFGIVCPPGPEGELEVCTDGVCGPVCDTVECPDDLVCRDTDGLCVPNNCVFLDLCEEDELCIDEACVVDPCFDVDCPAADEFCRDGACVASCGGVTCPTGEVCHDGACQPTGCDEDCPAGQVCDSGAGACEPDPCVGVSCGAQEVCDPSSGECVIDPCLGIDCPAGEVCVRGDCFDFAPGMPPDAGPPRELVQPGGGGCSTGGSAGWLGALVVLAGVVLLRRRHWRGLGAAVVLCAALGATSGCSLDPFCVNCDQTGGGADDDGGTGPIDAGVDAQIDSGPGCDAGVVQAELCDGTDNDCDTNIDEGFDFDEDPLNCGACGIVCDKPGAKTRCGDGDCEIVECFPGNVDLDGDITGPYNASNGCEYACFVSNGGVEACDGLDNDCDGAVDEDTDFDGDELNCGECGRVCNLFQATTTCTGGVCGFNPATDCNPGFFDIDGDQATGCEYACSETGGGSELCDLVDNDCDGAVDETFDHATDVGHCGQCNRACAFPNATPLCTGGACTFTDCAPGFHDVDGVLLNGCEYACTESGIEVCDGVDNDCNGVVDDMPADAGGACNAAPGGVATGACADDGVLVCSLGALVCVGATQPGSETCNNVDDDCDDDVDEAVTRACYTGPGGTEGVGICGAGVETCVAGVFTGGCVGETTPAATEACNNLDDDCDAAVDEGTGGGPLTIACYTGPAGTEGQGACIGGTATCQFGALGDCVGQVTPVPDLCGDGVDTDCDNLDDVAEGCVATDAGAIRLDAPGGSEGTAAGAAHSFDVQVASAGSNVYAVWSDLASGASDVLFRRSTDGGATFGTILNLTSGTGDPSVKPIVVAAGTRVYVVYQRVVGGTRRLHVAASADAGASFATDVRLDADDNDSFHHHAAVSADGQTVAVAWEELNTATLTRDVVSRVSTNGGALFLPQRVVNRNSGASPVAGRPQVAVTGSGRFVWAWREARAGDTFDVFATFSDSATAAIPGGNESRLDSDAGDARASDFPQLAVDGDAVYVVWQDVSTTPGGGADVVFVRSTNGGASFGAERILDDPAGEVSASFTPSLAVDAAGDRVFVAWEDRREGTQIYASASGDGGATFGAAIRASSLGGEPVSGTIREPALVYAGGDTLVVAYVVRAGGVDRVFATSSVDAGATWQLSHAGLDLGPGPALEPAIAAVTGGGLAVAAIVVWTDFRTAPGINGDPHARRVGR